MSPLSQDNGIVVICDENGSVIRLPRDDLGLVGRLPVGGDLRDLVDTEAREKLEKFLAELRTKDAAYDWEITVSVDGVPTPLHFAGARMPESFLVVAAGTRGGLAQLNEELMLINNEQTNALRAALKDLSVHSKNSANADHHLYEDLSRLNNELANLQRQMAKKNAELESLNELKNRFLGVAAHDLRSPLGVILSFSEFLETEAADVLNEEQLEFVTTIKETSEFMLNLVGELLDVSTIESGQLNLDRQPVDLVQLLQRSVALHRVLAGKKEISVEFDAPAAAVVVDCDPGKIVQVLNNLIDNAVKFSHRDTMVRVQLTIGDQTATIVVRDQGQGIPEKDLAKVFTAFGKVGVRSTAGERSTGLGLAICRKIIEGHGGRIWVESEVGSGSIFSFILPVEAGETEAESPPTRLHF